MKTLKALSLVLVLVTQFKAFAGPVISGGGDSPHPALVTMSIEKPVAGIDYPTETVTRMKSVLVLFDNVRIPIFAKSVKLVKPVAGLDFPTDMETPFWATIQKVLQYKNQYHRTAVQLTVDDNNLTWHLPTQDVIISEISHIQVAEAGIDYPTEVPPQDSLVIVLKDESRVRLQ